LHPGDIRHWEIRLSDGTCAFSDAGKRSSGKEWNDDEGELSQLQNSVGAVNYWVLRADF
jgi:hypothetical protein